MAHTKVTRAHSANTGTANTFSYSGSFDVFKGTEVVVTLDGIALTFTSSTINEAASPREYTVDTTAKTIHIGGADLSSGSIVIRPQTDMGDPTPRANYTPGASIAAADLNNNQLQLMRKAMEYDDTKMNTTGTSVMTGDLQLGVGINIIYEGATDDAYETTLTVADPTADRTITLPNVTGTVVTTGDSGTVATGMIAADAINGTKIADDALDSEHYTDGSIDAAHLASNAVTTVKINSDAVTGAKIADDAIDSEHYVDGSIDNAHLANSAVDTEELADNAVSIAKIGCEQTTISDSDSHIPTSGAVVDYVSAQITPLGGFEAIADEDNFPTTVPAAGVIVSIADATGVTVGGSGTSTTARTAGNGSDNVTINNFPSSLHSAALPNNTGLLVISTGSSHTYNFHRLLPTTDDVKQLSDDVNDFFARYRIASSAPGSNNDAGDIYFNTSNDTFNVRNAANNAWITAVSSTPNDDSVTAAKLDLSIVQGDVIYGTGTDTWARLAKGTAGQFLKMNSGATAPEWAADNNTQLTEEQVEDFVGGMVTGNTETGITVTYEDGDGTLDFVTEVTLAGAETFTGVKTFNAAAIGEVTTISSSSNATALNLQLSNNFKITLDENSTISQPTNQVEGQSGSIFVTQDGTGSRTLAYHADFKWVGGTAPTLSTAANAVDRIDYVVAAANKIHAVASLDVK